VFAACCAAGGKTDESGVPLNPVRGGLPMAGDELAAFKLVGAALLMAYVEVRVHSMRMYGPLNWLRLKDSRQLIGAGGSRSVMTSLLWCQDVLCALHCQLKQLHRDACQSPEHHILCTAAAN
jgi:hypothetical protein